MVTGDWWKETEPEPQPLCSLLPVLQTNKPCCCLPEEAAAKHARVKNTDINQKISQRSLVNVSLQCSACGATLQSECVPGVF